MYDTLDTIRVQRTYIDSLQPTYHLQPSPNDTHSSLVEHRPFSIISVPANASSPVFSNPNPTPNSTPSPVFSNPTTNPMPNSTPSPVFSNPTPSPVFSNPTTNPMPNSIFPPVFSNPTPNPMPNSISPSNPIPQLHQNHPISIEQPQINEQITSLNNAIHQLRQDHINQQKEIEYLKQLLAAKENYTEPDPKPEPAPEPKVKLPLRKDEIPVINEPSPHDNITIHDYTDESIKDISGTTLILFYTPTCPHCVTLKPLYTFMAPIFIKHNITVGMLNGAENRNTLREFKIQGVPTIILVHNNERHVYQGPRILKDIVHWVQHIVTNVDLNLIHDESITINE
jgi:thiol-disulfide isomerase/thioredoxin